MASIDIDKIYKELLRIYSARYENPKAILSYKIIELKREGRTREEAIRKLYAEEEELTSEEEKKLEEAIKRKKAEEEKLKESIRKKKEDEAIKQQIHDYEERIERLTILFSEGEISEESYIRATRTIEKSIDKLRKKTTTPSTKITPARSSYPTYEKKPMPARGERGVIPPNPTLSFLFILGIIVVILGFVVPYLLWLLLIVVIVSSVAVYADAKNIETITGRKTASPIGWAIAVLLLWLIMLPIYVFYTRREVQKIASLETRER